MLSVIGINDRIKWNEVISSFSEQDVYYLRGYVKAFEEHGDGEPVLLSFISENNRAVCVMLKRDISNDPHFAGKLPPDKWYDMTTPYGYGGFIFFHTPDDSDLLLLETQLKKILVDNGIISAFFRFHPVLNNSVWHEKIMQVIPLGKTIAMDLSSPEVIWQNISSKNRNMIRKAEKNGIEIRHGKGMQLLTRFREIYDNTMRRDNAAPYYFFEDAFYRSIDNDLRDNHEIFYAVKDGCIIAMSIMIFAGNRMHYHLSGSEYEYRQYAPSNLLLYKAALWGHEQGFKTLHLGGGVGSGEDALYRFKAAFNRNSDYTFAIGRLIADRQRYDSLVAMRGMTADQLSASGFFPAYRAETPPSPE